MEPETTLKTDRERCAELYVALLDVSQLSRAGETTDAAIVAERALAAERNQQEAEIAATMLDDDGGNAYGHIADDEQMEAVPRCGLDAFSDRILGGLPS